MRKTRFFELQWLWMAWYITIHPFSLRWLR